MDFVVDDIIVELKSVTHLIAAHRAQFCNYLRLTRKPVGLLINFSDESLIGERWRITKTPTNASLSTATRSPSPMQTTATCSITKKNKLMKINA